MYYLKGRIAIFTFMAAETYYDVTEDEGDWFSDAWQLTQFTTGTIFLFAPEIRFVGPAVAEGAVNWAGRMAWAAAKSPLGMAIEASVLMWLGGLAISDRIDPVSGTDNYIGFTTGGVYGESDIHYLTGGAGDSGYFNVPKNVGIIGKHYYDKAGNTAREFWEKTQEPWWSV